MKPVETKYATIDRDELKRLQKDAERYRWLREKANFTREDAPQVVITDWSGMIVSVSPSAYPQLEKLDQAIDAAILQGGESDE